MTSDRNQSDSVLPQAQFCESQIILIESKST